MRPRDDLITISNVLTLSRLFLLPFIVVFLLMNQRIAAFVVIAISLLSDAIDGFLARKLKQESETGKKLDPVCDKVSLAVILVTLYIINALPLWGVIVIVMRDVFILVGSYILLRQKSVVYTSDVLGKITGFIFGALILAYTIELKTIGNILLYLSIPAIVASFLVYVRRYVYAMKGEG